MLFPDFIRDAPEVLARIHEKGMPAVMWLAHIAQPDLQTGCCVRRADLRRAGGGWQMIETVWVRHGGEGSAENRLRKGASAAAGPHVTMKRAGVPALLSSQLRRFDGVRGHEGRMLLRGNGRPGGVIFSLAFCFAVGFWSHWNVPETVSLVDEQSHGG